MPRAPSWRTCAIRVRQNRGSHSGVPITFVGVTRQGEWCCSSLQLWQTQRLPPLCRRASSYTLERGTPNSAATSFTTRESVPPAAIRTATSAAAASAASAAAPSRRASSIATSSGATMIVNSPRIYDINARITMGSHTRMQWPQWEVTSACNDDHGKSHTQAQVPVTCWVRWDEEGAFMELRAPDPAHLAGNPRQRTHLYTCMPMCGVACTCAVAHKPG